jgi:hypothetical protein
MSVAQRFLKTISKKPASAESKTGMLKCPNCDQHSWQVLSCKAVN